jgi:hypothetical protein
VWLLSDICFAGRDDPAIGVNGNGNDLGDG